MHPRFRFSATRPLLAIAAATFPALMGLHGAAGQFHFRVGTMDDLNRYIPGTLVEVEVVGGNTHGLTSLDDGFTRFVSMDPDAVAIVTLAETAYAGGVSLGQKMLETMPGMELPVDEYDYTRVYFQPRALPVFITTANRVFPEPYHTRWTFVPFLSPNTSIGFQAQVAILLNPPEIERYQAYYGVEFPRLGSGDEYELGLVIRTTTLVDLGQNNLGLELDCAGHAFGSVPAVSTALVRPPALAATALRLERLGNTIPSATIQPATEPYSFSGTVDRWEPSTETALISLRGVLEPGDNILLLSSRHPLSSGPRQAASAPDLSARETAVTDCLVAPPAPPPGWTCMPPFPVSSCPVILGSTFCGTKTISNNRAKCGSSGTSQSSGWRSHWGGSIAIKAVANGVEATLTGQYGWEITGSTTYTFGPGDNGCGQCMQDFQHFLSCIAVDTLRRNTYTAEVVAMRVVWDEQPCAEEYTRESECNRTQGPSTMVCSRTCN